MSNHDTQIPDPTQNNDRSNSSFSSNSECDSNGEEAASKKGCCSLRCWAGFLKRNLLLILLLVGLAAGIGMGAGLSTLDPPMSKRDLMYFKFPGDLLMRMLKALIIPLIVSSLVSGLAGLESVASGKMGLCALIYYFSTTIIAVLLGILLVCTIEPGVKSDVSSSQEPGTAEPANIADSFLDLVRNMFPDNLVEACFRQTKTSQIPVYGYVNETLEQNVTESWLCDNDTSIFSDTYTTCNVTQNVSRVLYYDFSVKKEDGMNVLGLVVFSVALGIVVSRMGAAGRPLYLFCLALAEATMKLVTLVIWYSPIGVMFLIAAEITGMEDPLEELAALGLYMATVLAGLAIHGLLILPLIYVIFVRKNPLRYMYGMLQALLTAFGTASSSATLPVTYRCLEQNNGIDKRVTRFLLPVGATINMDGTALYEAVAAIFIAQSNGMQLNAAQIVATSITATLASIGAASVPQAGLVTMVIVLSVLGLPAEEISKIIAVDWLLDRFRTTVNVEGDAIGAAVVSHLCRKQLEDSTSEENAPIPNNLNPNHPDSNIPPSLGATCVDVVIYENQSDSTSVGYGSVRNGNSSNSQKRDSDVHSASGISISLSKARDDGKDVEFSTL